MRSNFEFSSQCSTSCFFCQLWGSPCNFSKEWFHETLHVYICSFMFIMLTCLPCLIIVCTCWPCSMDLQGQSTDLALGWSFPAMWVSGPVRSHIASPHRMWWHFIACLAFVIKVACFWSKNIWSLNQSIYDHIYTYNYSLLFFI